MLDAENPNLECFRDYLLLLARTQLGDGCEARIDASDIVQQTLMNAHRQRDHFRGENKAQTMAWLRQILSGCLKDAFKALGRAKRDRRLEVGVDQSAARLEEWLAGDQTSPSLVAQKEEQVLQLIGALNELPEGQREALVWRHCHGLTLAEISERMGCNLSSVAGLIARGSKRLRGLIEGDCSRTHV